MVPKKESKTVKIQMKEKINNDIMPGKENCCKRFIKFHKHINYNPNSKCGTGRLN